MIYIILLVMAQLVGLARMNKTNYIVGLRTDIERELNTMKSIFQEV